MSYPHLAARIFNTPLLVHPAKLDAIIAGLGARLLGAESLAAVAQNAAPGLFSTAKGQRSERGYTITDGVAVINVRGALVHRTRLDADSSLLIGYNDIAADLDDAMANDAVHAIAMVWDSPGGEAQGAWELAERIHALRGGAKPIVSIVDGMAASAAYLVASAADELVASPNSYVGSIGVVLRHVDFSHALHADGVKVTHIFAGAHKVDGNPYEPLPDSVRASLQADVDGLYQQFIDAVALHRSLPAQAVRDTQAQVYRGIAAKTLGLVDRLGHVDQIIAELAGRRSRRAPQSPAGATSPAFATAHDKGALMSGHTPAGGQNPATTAAAPEKALPDAAMTQARADGHAAGVQAERERCAAILGHARATTHAALAQQCIAIGLSAEQSAALLDAAPDAPAAPDAATQAAAAQTATHAAFAGAMTALGNPAVTGIERDTAAADDAAGLAAQVLNSLRTSA